MNDKWALLITFAYCWLVLGVAEVVHSKCQVTAHTARKLVHVAIGTWALPTLYLFHSWQYAIVAPVVFSICNLISMRYRVFPQWKLEEHVSAGSVLYPLSFIWLVIAFWNSPFRAAAGIGLMVMTYGDAMASIVGGRWGRRRALIFGSIKTLEGSAAMFATSFVVAFVLLLALHLAPPKAAALIALLLSWVAASVEFAGPRGIDNLTVPLAVAYVCFRLLK